ncbi:MAG: hypothetical protein LBL66_10225, partial [Clostridiales bacterium]|nr:hypothetical protein [Clostridiales bacterium]
IAIGIVFTGCVEKDGANIKISDLEKKDGVYQTREASVNMSQYVKVNGDCTWEVAKNASGEDPIKTTVVPLNAGTTNTVYVFVYNKNGNVKSYELKFYREKLNKIYYLTNIDETTFLVKRGDGWEVLQSVYDAARRYGYGNPYFYIYDVCRSDLYAQVLEYYEFDEIPKPANPQKAGYSFIGWRAFLTLEDVKTAQWKSNE